MRMQGSGNYLCIQSRLAELMLVLQIGLNVLQLSFLSMPGNVCRILKVPAAPCL